MNNLIRIHTATFVIYLFHTNEKGQKLDLLPFLAGFRSFTNKFLHTWRCKAIIVIILKHRLSYCNNSFFFANQTRFLLFQINKTKQVDELKTCSTQTHTNSYSF